MDLVSGPITVTLNFKPHWRHLDTGMMALLTMVYKKSVIFEIIEMNHFLCIFKILVFLLHEEKIEFCLSLIWIQKRIQNNDSKMEKRLWLLTDVLSNLQSMVWCQCFIRNPLTVYSSKCITFYAFIQFQFFWLHEQKTFEFFEFLEPPLLEILYRKYVIYELSEMNHILCIH